jgi:hypothetical protein
VLFRLTKATATINGHLVLGDGDPLALLVDEEATDEDAITAWTTALLGFADATCIEVGSAEPAPPRERSAQRRRASSSVRQRLSSAPSLPRT